MVWTSGALIVWSGVLMRYDKHPRWNTAAAGQAKQPQIHYPEVPPALLLDPAAGALEQPYPPVPIKLNSKKQFVIGYQFVSSSAQFSGAQIASIKVEQRKLYRIVLNYMWAGQPDGLLLLLIQ